MNTTSLFHGRTLVVATAHGKERAIAPLLEDAFGLTCIVPEGLYTDALGTFSGEIERALTPLDAAREKCLLALKATGHTLAIASEGSFGPHPSLLFVPCDDELLVLMDVENNVEITVREMSTSTNFAVEEIAESGALKAFAQRVGFPAHGLILRGKFSDGRTEKISKGIQSESQLESQLEDLLREGASVTAETDMRAHFNPTRMEVIAKAAEKLVARMAALCPQCALPGFGRVGYVPGLPCELCGSPTASSLYAENGCVRCDYTEREAFPHGKQEEDPMYCAFCNP